MYEATCPTCGMTADVAANIEQVRCKGCGTIVHLVDHAVPVAAAAPALTAPLPQVVAAEPAVDPSRVGMATAIGVLGPLVVGFAFGIAHDAIDQPDPDTGTAGFFYLAAALLGLAAAIVGIRFCLRPGRRLAPSLLTLLSAVPTFVVAMVAGQAYDDNGGAWAVLGLPLLGVYVIGVGIAAAVLANRHDGSWARTLLVGGVGIAIGLAVAALLMLMTLQDQAADARRAHETPAWGFFLVVGVLLVTAAARRRRLTT